ncbi:MAG: hypothetical protein HC869_21225, partial [Rhodospirillales bacterium]|nr:hypothetical protein [Rhodospirillales bacterium]
MHGDDRLELRDRLVNRFERLGRAAHRAHAAQVVERTFILAELDADAASDVMEHSRLGVGECVAVLGLQIVKANHRLLHIS